MEHDKLKEIFNRYKHNYLLDGHKTSTPLMDFNNFKYAAWCIENSSQLEPPVSDDFGGQYKKLIEAITTLLYEDAHHWSTRPCPTCRAISAIIKKPFGCYQYAEQEKNVSQNSR